MGTAPLWSLLCVFGIFHVQLTFGTLDEFKGPLPLFIGSRPIFGFSGQHLRDVKPADADYEKTFTQTLDHFNDNDKRTFQQRYYVNTEWKSSTNGAVHILWLEGEGTASAFTVSNISLPHLALAKDLGATAWALEHRFYGKSQPFTDRPVSNMVYLSSKQAVEDIADFINAQNKASNEKSPKWIVVGSSYGGSLVLWFRRKYPSLTVGAVSDSAAVSPTIDFWSYEKIVEEVYANYSYACWHGIKFSALAIRNEAQYAEGVERMNKELNLQPPIDDDRVDYKDFQNLHHNIIKLFELPVLLNGVNIGPFSNSCGVVDLCSIVSLEDGGADKDVDRVYDWAKFLYSNLQGSFTGIANDYGAVVSYVNNTQYSENNLAQASARSWLWQQCTEFGQFITTDAGYGLFANTIPNDYYIALCQDAFENTISLKSLKAGVKNTTKSFDTSHYFKGTNTLIFNGQLDPWNSLGVNSTQDSSSIYHLVPDVGRGAVLQPVSKYDSASLTRARKYVLQRRVSNWVKSKNGKPEAFDENWSEPKSTFNFEQNVPKFQEIKNWNSKIVYGQHPPPIPPGGEHDLSPDLPGASAEKAKQFEPVHLRIGYLLQDVDHFGNTNKDQFYQRFFLTKEYQRDSDAPRFLMLGGMETIYYYYYYNYMEVEFAFHQYATDFRAVMYVLEHRYFGRSQVYPITTIEHLQYLTTEQAVADTAIFIKNVNKMENLTTWAQTRWVVFGGAYGGTLAACFRLRFPELTVGAVASSAPMLANVDFPELMQKTEQDIREYAGHKCVKAIRDYFGWIRRKLNTRPGRVELKKALCIGNDWNINYVEEKDVQTFLFSEVQELEWILEWDSEDHEWLESECKYKYEKIDKNWDVGDTDRAKRLEKMRQMKKYRRPKLAGMKNWLTTQGVNRRKRGADSCGASQNTDLRSNYYSESWPYNHNNDEKYSTYWSKSEVNRQNNDHGSRMYFVKPDDPDYTANYTDPDDDSQDSLGSDEEGAEPILCYLDYCPYGCRWPYNYNEDLGFLEEEEWSWSGRGRLWMQCTQWGWLSSTNYGYNLVESSMNINYMLDFCTDVFGEKFNRISLEGAVRHTNYLWGGQENYNGTKVIFVNGSEDPWSVLGVYEPLQPSTMSIYINGTSHMADMFRERRSDVKALKLARKKIKNRIIKWVKKY